MLALVQLQGLFLLRRPPSLQFSAGFLQLIPRLRASVPFRLHRTGFCHIVHSVNPATSKKETP
jgi:hypothetical protein